MSDFCTYKSLLATVCQVIEYEVSVSAAAAFCQENWESPITDELCTADFAGELLRRGGVPNTSVLLPPKRVQSTVVAHIESLHAVLLSFRHPLCDWAVRWLLAYGKGPHALYTVASFEPGEPSLGPTELWPNVTGQVLVVNGVSPHGVKIEIVGISSIFDEEESY